MVIQLNQPYSFCQRGQRDNQEDARFPNTDSPSQYEPFFIVCDGVGGGDDGEVASQTVCQSLSKALRRFNWEKDEFTTDDFCRALDSVYDALGEADKSHHSDMATTLTFVCFHRGGCTMAHLGDSRIYQLRPDRGILYRSNDHALVNELVHAGILSPERTANHPERSTITRYMAPASDQSERSMASIIRTTDVLPGDIFFLCTDGVLNAVDDEQLEKILCGDGSDKEKRDRIAALSYNSSDNNTAYLISIAGVEGNSPVDERYYEQEADEHITVRTQRTYPVADDVEVMQRSKGIGGKVNDFLKKVFK